MSATSAPHGRRSSPEIVALALGLAPLLGFADTLVRGMLLGLATLVAGGLIALMATVGSRLPPVSRVPFLLLAMAAFLTVFEVACRATAFDAWLAAGALLPLVVANGGLLRCGAPDGGASAPGLARRLTAGLSAGAALLLVLVLVGAAREVTGHGTLGSANLGATGATGFGLAAAPAGGLFLLALLVAGANALYGRRLAGGASAP